VYEAEIELSGAPRSVSEARRFALEVLETGGKTDDVWMVAQVVSELATNAVVHAGTAFVLNIAYDDSSIRVSVTDRKPLARAVVRRFSHETTTGRGLRLIQLLGRAWGVDQTESAKTVWCDLRRGAVVRGGVDLMWDEALSDVSPHHVEFRAIDPTATARAGVIGNSRDRLVA
jgi:anti-sigma regulatory factor (Ser/Thr protein kinase)